MKDLELLLEKIEVLRRKISSIEARLITILSGKYKEGSFDEYIDNINDDDIDGIEAYGVNQQGDKSYIRVKTGLSQHEINVIIPKNVTSKLIREETRSLVCERKTLINELNKYKIIKS